MADGLNREDAGRIAHKLTECRNILQKGNIFSCLLKFKEILEKINTTVMIPADEKKLQKEINDFQRTLSANKNFLGIYGPVTFRDNEIAPSLALMQQLIEIKNDEMQELLDEQAKDMDIAGDSAQETDDAESRLNIIKTLIENGDDAAALELLKDKDDLAYGLAEAYNRAGIEHRQSGRYDEALRTFNHALIASPRDEGLYYNMARVYIAQGEWKTAAETINEGLKINHDFTEGIKLLKYIRETGRIDSDF